MNFFRYVLASKSFLGFYILEFLIQLNLKTTHHYLTFLPNFEEEKNECV